MRTQATQTDVRKSQPSVSVQAAKIPDVPRAQQKKVKQFYFLNILFYFLIYQSWMVSESVQTNGLVSPPGHPLCNTNHPPQNWFQSLHRPHHKQNGQHGEFHVQVYNLDSNTTTSNFSPPRTSTPLSGQVNTDTRYDNMRDERIPKHAPNRSIYDFIFQYNLKIDSFNMK